MIRRLRNLFALLIWLLPITALAACPVVQYGHQGVNGGTSIFVTLPSVASGDTIWVAVGVGGTTFPSSVSDSGGTLTGGPSQLSTNPLQAQYYELSAAPGTHTITVSNGSAMYMTVSAAELCASSASALDGTQPAIKTGSGTSAATNSSTPSQANDLLIGFANVQGQSAGMASSWSNGFAQVDSSTLGSASAWSDLTDSGATSINTAATLPGSFNWSAGLMAFKGAAPGTCTHSGITKAGAIAVPTAGVTVVRLKNGSFGTVDCSTISYFQTIGNFGVN